MLKKFGLGLAWDRLSVWFKSLSQARFGLDPERITISIAFAAQTKVNPFSYRMLEG